MTAVPGGVDAFAGGFDLREPNEGAGDVDRIIRAHALIGEVVLSRYDDRADPRNCSEVVEQPFEWTPQKVFPLACPGCEP
jgi:hypothetical protein